MKAACLIVAVTVLLMGCRREHKCDPANERPGNVSISRYTPPLQPESEDEDHVFVPVDSDSDDSSDEDQFHIIIDDAPLRQVVREFTRASGANIIAAPSTLQGRVTANLEGVDAISALETILDMHNCWLLESPPGSGVYRIDPHVPGAPEPMTVEVYPVDSEEEAEEVANALKEALADSHPLRIAAVPSRKAIIVNAPQRCHYLIEDIMDTLNEDEK